MNKTNRFLSLALLSSCIIAVSGCNGNKRNADKDNIVFIKDDIVLDAFEGLGVEWGTYEDPDKLSASSWKRSLEIMDRLNPQVTRCMLNYDWFITNFDDKYDDDKSNDTWEYNFANKYMDNTIDVLRYCDDHNIDVAFGCWNVPGNVGADQYNMFTEVTSDARWAKMTADILEYLTENQGIRCIKYFVNSNEPNYSGIEGKSKNYNNSFEIWAQGVKNVRKALDERDLDYIKIVGGDTTGFEGTEEYFMGISKDKALREAVGDYGFHVYCPNMTIDRGNLAVSIRDVYKKTKKNDGQLGVTRMPHIWEAGLYDGKNAETDSNALIANFSYGLRMADYTLQCVTAGVNSIVYWDFDDGMHFMYHEDGTTNSKGWGMFSSLSTDSATKQKLRPWYHSSVLLTNLMRKGSKIMDYPANDPEIDNTFRSMGVIGPEEAFAGIVAVNRGMLPVTKTFRMAHDFKDSGKVYVYIYNENELQLGDDGFVKANQVLDYSLKDQIEVSVPASTMVILSSKELQTMKKRFLGLLLLPLMLGACSGGNGYSYDYDSHTVIHERKTGEIADFDLTGPADGFITDDNFRFTWENCSNADYYVLEIASTTEFYTDDNDEVYVKESNISNNRFDLTYSLPKKDIQYFWKVTAINKDHSKRSTSVCNFYYKAKDVGEIPIKIEDEQDWVLHKEGSYADIKIDRTDFFGTGNDSLAIIFDKEHTNQGIPSSDGWIVVTKNEDRELYGTDAFYFNFYYSGHDATVLVRVLDYDGEYWHKQVQIANNSKQTVIVKYSDFELRTAGTNIFNRRFDWEHIRYFEIVFERTFGDGICLFSDIKAVQFNTYKNMFVDKMDFRSTDPKDWTYENFDFRNDMVISEDGSEITLNYKARNAETNPNGFNGYGFQNINVYRFFIEGDALRMKVKYTGTGNSAMFYFRILEEDNDRWQFKTPFSYFVRDEYKELIIPLKAFQRTDYMTGDGAKQFYYIQKLNIGLADNYTTGSLSIKDLEVIKIDDIVENRKKVVSADGCIEDFNDYNIYTEIYYYWEQSIVNKDEAMKLDTTHKAGGSTNTYCAEFDYKADMEMATYQLYMDASAATNKNAFSIWLKDASVKPEDSAIAYLKDEEVAAEMTIQLTMDSGEWYRYIIPVVGKEWQKYTLAFDDVMVKDDAGNVTHNGWFLENERSLFDDPKPLSSEHIIHMAFGFKYLYYDQQGNHHPTYAIANPVYIDEIYFTNASQTSVEELSGTIKEDDDGSGRITVEDMESYATNNDIFDYWSYGNSLSYSLVSLSDEVSSKGGNHSIKMHYKGSDSVSYARITLFAKTVTARSVMLDIKGDGKATVYLNLNWRVSSSSLVKMRYTISNIPTSWTHYEIGFDFFKDVNGSSKSLSNVDARNIESISFGIVNNSSTESDIYVDNLRLFKDGDYEDKIVTPINQEVMV